MIPFENLHEYSPVQYLLVHHVLTLGYAAMVGGFVFFTLSSSAVAQKFRLASILGAVVMASAFFELYVQANLWKEAFALNVETGRFALVGDTLFSNGFRYMNWSIDVPALLTQILVVLGFTGAAFKSNWIKFTLAGLAMIWTGYVGQYYQTADDLVPFYAWGLISTVFFLYIIHLVRKTIEGNLESLPAEARPLMKGTMWLLIVSWWLYPVGYAMPLIEAGPWGSVTRQLLYTAADISSKVAYGVCLTFVAMRATRAERARHGHHDDVTRMLPDADAYRPQAGAPQAGGVPEGRREPEPQRA